MKNIILAVLATISISVAAHAVGDGLVENTEVYRSTITCGAISISSYSATSIATDVVGSTTAAIMQILLQNMEASANLYANDNPAVSTTTTAGVRGVKIPVIANGFDGVRKFVLVQGQKWYATCDKTTGPCDANLCKGR